MKKITTFCLLACAFTSSKNTFGMLIKQTLRTKKHIRTYHMQSLPSKNIFNTNIDPETTNPHQLGLLEDLYDRNNNAIRDLKKQINILEEQKMIALTRYRGYSLDIKTLEYLELQLQKSFKE